MKVLDWLLATKKSKVNSKLADSTALTGSIGDFEKDKFVSVWDSKEFNAVLSPKELNRL